MELETRAGRDLIGNTATRRIVHSAGIVRPEADFERIGWRAAADARKPEMTDFYPAGVASNKAKARQNILVSVVNTALERGLLTLACEPLVSATFEYTLAGLPMIAEIHDVGFDEVHLYAYCCPTDLGRTHIGAFPHEWKRFGAAWTFGCLERRTGKYLQTTVSFNGSRIVTAQLASVVIEPVGFGLHPTKGGYDFLQEWEAVVGKKPKRKIAA
jgi:hypothetical protein